MKFTTALYGLFAATGALSQGTDIDGNPFPDLKTDGPYALHVKGQGKSLIDGYLYAVHEFETDHDPDAGVSVLHYRPAPAPAAFNSSYRFYFNSTVDDNSGMGFVVTDINASNSSNSDKLYKGKPMFWTHFPGTNIAWLELGSGANPYSTYNLGFGKDGRAYVYFQGHNDAEEVVGKRSDETAVKIQNGWVICWQTTYTIAGYTLSWITFGDEPHNPTCQRVDLTRMKL